MWLALLLTGWVVPGAGAQGDSMGALTLGDDGRPEGWTATAAASGAAWKAGSDAAGRPILVCPPLPAGEQVELTSAELDLAPWHRYRIEVAWRGGLFYRWTVSVRYRLENGREAAYRLFPERGGLAPVPEWEGRRFEFIVPSGAETGRLVLTVEGEGDSPFRPAVRLVRLTDLGPEPLDGTPPGAQPPPTVSSAELESNGGGRGYLRGQKKRYLWTQAGRTVEGAGVILTGVWARGEGRFRFTARMYAAGRGRFWDFAGPQWELTDEWRKYTWELPVLFTAQHDSRAEIVADVWADGTVELDEPWIQAIQSSRPPPLADDELPEQIPDGEDR